MMRLQIIQSGDKQFFWRLIANNGKDELARSTETYVEKRHTAKMAERVTSFQDVYPAVTQGLTTVRRIDKTMNFEYAILETVDQRPITSVSTVSRKAVKKTAKKIAKKTSAKKR